MKQYPCANSWCSETTDKPGTLCIECQRAEDKKSKSAWMWAGWTRGDNNNDASNHHKKDGTK